MQAPPLPLLAYGRRLREHSDGDSTRTIIRRIAPYGKTAPRAGQIIASRLPAPLPVDAPWIVGAESVGEGPGPLRRCSEDEVRRPVAPANVSTVERHGPSVSGRMTRLVPHRAGKQKRAAEVDVVFEVQWRRAWRWPVFLAASPSPQHTPRWCVSHALTAKTSRRLHPSALQLRVSVELRVGASWKLNEALANGKVAPGKPSGAGQPALR
jgi:hypothetical protein